METSRRCLSRILVWLICVPLALSPGAGSPLPGASQDRANGAVDFAAMTLTPEDLSDAGLDDFRLDSGRLMSFDDAVASISQDTGETEAEVAEQLRDLGFTYWYQTELYLPADAADSGEIGELEVFCDIMEFSDEERAEDAWDLLQDESGNEDAEDLPEAEEFGDLSEATMYLTEIPGIEDEVFVLDVTFLLENFMLGVRIFERDGSQPDLSDGEALAGLLEERAEQILEDGGPGLSRQVLRLHGDEVVPSVDNYLLLDGDAIHFYYETSEEREDREEEAADIDQTDEYAVWQQLAALSEDQVDDVWYMLTLRRFDRQRDAGDWLEGIEAEIEDNPAYTNFEIDERAPEFGEESLSFSMEWAEGPIAYAGIAIRIDDLVVTIYLQGGDTPPADAVEALADAQVACMEEGCVESVEIPEELEDYIDELASVPAAGVLAARVQATASTTSSAPVRLAVWSMTGTTRW